MYSLLEIFDQPWGEPTHLHVAHGGRVGLDVIIADDSDDADDSEDAGENNPAKRKKGAAKSKDQKLVINARLLLKQKQIMGPELAIMNGLMLETQPDGTKMARVALNNRKITINDGDHEGCGGPYAIGKHTTPLRCASIPNPSAPHLHPIKTKPFEMDQDLIDIATRAFETFCKGVSNNEPYWPALNECLLHPEEQNLIDLLNKHSLNGKSNDGNDEEMGMEAPDEACVNDCVRGNRRDEHDDGENANVGDALRDVEIVPV